MMIFKNISVKVFRSGALAALLLAGCSTVTNYQNLLQSWVGSPEQRLVANWGAPSSVVNEGQVRLLTYVRAGDTYVTGYAGGWAVPLFCTTTFTLNNGVVVGAQFRGNECVSE